VGTRDTGDLCLETGHIGIYVSSKSQKQFTPKIVQWLKQREGVPESESNIVAEAEYAGRQTVAEAEPVSHPRPAPDMDAETLPAMASKPKSRQGVSKTESVSKHQPDKKVMTGKTAAASKALPKKKKAPMETRTSA
jgi:hypothetical protein